MKHAIVTWHYWNSVDLMSHSFANFVTFLSSTKRKCHRYDIIVLNKLTLTQSKYISVMSQINNVAIFFEVFGAHMHTVFINKVKISFFSGWNLFRIEQWHLNHMLGKKALRGFHWYDMYMNWERLALSNVILKATYKAIFFIKGFTIQTP